MANGVSVRVSEMIWIVCGGPSPDASSTTNIKPSVAPGTATVVSTLFLHAQQRQICEYACNIYSKSSQVCDSNNNTTILVDQ